MRARKTERETKRQRDRGGGWWTTVIDNWMWTAHECDVSITMEMSLNRMLELLRTLKSPTINGGCSGPTVVPLATNSFL